MFVHLSTLTNFIINLYFNETNCAYMFIDGDICNTVDHANKQVVIFSIKNPDIQHVTNLIQGFQKVIIENKILCKGFIIQSKQSTLIFKYIEESLLFKLVDYQFNTRRYLFLPPKKNETAKYIKASHLQDILVIAHNQTNCGSHKMHVQCDEIYNLYTNSYTTDLNGNESLTTLLDIWSSKNGFYFAQNLYSDKTKNLQGITIRAIGFSYLPYVIFSKSGTNSSKTYGVDINILKLFAKTRNGTLTVLEDQNIDWQRLHGLVRRRQVDIALGGYRLSDLYKKIDLTTPYHHTNFKGMVPKPKISHTISTTFKMVSFNSYIILGVLYILLVLILCTIIAKTKIQSNVLNICLIIYGAFLSQPLPTTNILVRFKKFLLWIYFIGFLISSILNGGFAYILTIPRYERPINTIDELIESGLKLATVSIEDIILPLISSKQMKHKQIVEQFFEASYEEINEMVGQPDIGVAIEETYYNNYADEVIHTRNLKYLQLMREPLCSFYLSFACKKQWSLLPYLNDHILKVNEAGLIYHWEQEAIYIGSTLKHQESIRHSSAQQHGVEKLKLSHIYGAFVVLFLGSFLSFVAFTVEISYSEITERISNRRLQFAS